MSIPVFLLRLFYNLALVPAMRLALAAGSLTNPKFAARRAGLRQTYKTLRSLPSKKYRRRIWVHAASLGEFEQVKTIIAIVKKASPRIQVVVSFFSPSGYENLQGFDAVDAKVYLPVDSRRAARKFIKALAPDAVIFVRYDLWYNFLMELQRSSIPTILICATLNASSRRQARSLRLFTRQTYECFGTIFTAGANETEKFSAMNLHTELMTTADTRSDRIVEAVKQAADNPILTREYYRDDSLVLVAGSTWPADESILQAALEGLPEDLRRRLRIILAPHEPTEEHLQSLQLRFPTGILLSDLEAGLPGADSGGDAQYIIVNSIGKLLRLYGHADLALIGGGFGDGVHSVSEPAGYGIPLASGPDIERSPDAVALRDGGALTVFSSAEDLTDWLRLMLGDSDRRIQHGKIAADFINRASGFSLVIANRIISLLEVESYK